MRSHSSLRHLLILFIPLITLFIAWQPPNEPFQTFSESMCLVNELVEKSKALEEKRKYKAALEVLNEVYELHIQQKSWEKAVECLIEQSILADNFETPETKLHYSKLAVQLAQENLPSNHPTLATAFRQRAEGLIWIEQADSANYLLLLALPIFEQNKLWVDWGWSEVLLGVNYLNSYQLEECQRHLENAKQLLNKSVLEKADSINIQATVLSILGVLYQTQGDYDRAIDITKEALQISLAQSTIDSISLNTYLSNLGVFYTIKGDYQRALDYYIQGLNSHSSASEDDVLLFNVGDLFTIQKKYKQGIEYLRKSLEVVKNHPSQSKTKIDVFNSLASTFRRIGLYDSASYYCHKAIDIKHNYRKGTSWTIFGRVTLQQNQPQKAIIHFSNAIKAHQTDSTAESHSPFYLANIYNHLANAYLISGNSNTALHYFQKSLILNHATFRDSIQFENNPSLRGVFNPEYFMEALHGKAKALASFTESTTQMQTSLATYQLIGQWIDSLLIEHTTETASLDWAGQFKQVYEEAIDIAYHLYQNTNDLQYLNTALSFSEKSKNSLLLESLKAAEGKTYAGVPDSLLQREKDLNIDMVFYEKALQEAEINQEVAKVKLYQQYLSDTRLQFAAFQERLERDFPKFYTLKYGGQTISVEKIQAEILEEKTAFVEYFLGDSTAYAFVFTLRSAHFLQLESPNVLEGKTTAFRELLLNPYTFRQNAKNSLLEYQQKASSLYTSILAPILASFSTPVEQLILITDAFLHTIPLEALIVPSKDTIEGINFAKLPFILYDYPMQYAYSADLLLKNQIRHTDLSSNAKCLALAPSYEVEGEIARGNLTQLRGRVGKLEGTALEIQAIAQYFQGDFDFGKTANEEHFKALAPEYGIIHLAMHGVPDLENPNFNHLIFSSLRADSLEDNLLHHYEIANLDLQAQLAVLSACETGIGKYEKGEGVYSLARSFMYAGVPSVVMSLWKVSDYSTSQVMPYLYENLADGQSKEVALRSAKIRFLESAKLEHRHPFYWSAFVLLGDNRAIEQGGMVWWKWAIGWLLLLVLIRGIISWKLRR